MHIGGERAVVGVGTKRVAKEGVDRERVGLARLVGHLRGRLVDVDHRAVRVGEAHRHAGSGEHAGAVLHPLRRPVVVVRVEADAVIELDLRLCRPVAPRDAVSAVAVRRRDAGQQALPLSDLCRVVASELRRRPVGAVGGDVHTDLESLGGVRCSLLVGDRGSGIDVGAAAHALPVGDRAVGCAVREVRVEASGGPPVAVVVTGHDDHGLVPVREIPEARQRGGRRLHVLDEIAEQALLLIRLRDRDLVEVHPVRLWIARGGTVEEVVRPDRWLPVALLAGPRRVPLARVHDRPRQVIREGSGVTPVGPDAAPRHRRVRRRCGGV